MNLQVYKFLKAEAQADKEKALASIQLLTNHPAGIGDHSTKDYWDNCNEALKLLASADESLLVYPAWRNLHGVTKIIQHNKEAYRNSLIFYTLKYFNNKEQVNG